MSRLWRTNTQTVESRAVFSWSWIRNLLKKNPNRPKMGHNRPKFCVRYAKKYAGLKKYTTTSSGHRCKNKCFVLSKFDKSIIHFLWREEGPNKSATIFRCFLSFPRLWESGPQKTRHIFSQQQQLYDWVHPCVSVGEWTKTGGFSEKVSVGRCEVRQDLEKTKVSHGIGTGQTNDQHSGKLFRMDNFFSMLWW